ncbi:hypothetical protein INT47_008362 [Mucor saturninus]|uniref:W2 domain-containing protein n=1 Tax=Mucor saturninus TaxID=64648 RepID=A0A8H7RH23_9FUNG|nr:hypothetical protein INT47_008362 [Mucor saturninus]
MGTFPHYEGNPTLLFHLIDPAEMQYYLTDKSLAPLRKVPVCIAAAVYRISAGNCMPYTGTGNSDQPALPLNAYQRNESPWDSYRQRTKKLEDSSSSCSTLESTCSSRSDSPEPKHHHSGKKHQHRMLLREIRRLRGENEFLRSTVSVLKDDLRDSHLSRQNADIIHQRTFEEYDARYKSLEQDMVQKCDQVQLLKEQIEQLQLAACSHNSSDMKDDMTAGRTQQNDNAAYIKHKNTNNFGCFEFEEDDEGMACQPLAQESALPEVEIKMDELKTDDEDCLDYLQRRFHQTSDDEDVDDEEEEEEDVADLDLEPFEEAASSYIRQAIIAKLSSARVRLDFDDLIVKHEPSNDTIMAVLADAFVYWLYTQWTKCVDTMSSQKIFQNQIQPGIDFFWKSILQCYTVDEECQISLLHYIEDGVKSVGCPPLVNHFDRIIIFLYKYEVIEEDAVVDWHASPVNDEQSRNIRLVSKHFIEYIEEEDDSDEDDSDEEEDDDSIDFECDDSQHSNEDDGINFGFDDSEEEEDGEMHDSIEDLLSVKERNPCVCQFDYDDDTSQTPLSPHSHKSHPKHELPECSCDSTYTTQPATEKKKKSVRIAM